MSTAARATGDPGTVRLPTASAGALLVYSKSLNRTIAELYNEAYLSSSATLKPVDSWGEIAKAMAEYKSIDRLVLLVHGNPGRFLFGGPDAQGAFRSDMPLADAAKQLEAMRVKPTVRVLDLGGCNVGIDVGAVVKFGLAAGASQVVATNHFHEFALTRLDVPRGKTEAAERDLLGLRGYVATPGADALIEQGRTRNVSRLLLLEWYVAFPEEAKLSLPAKAADTNARAKTFKRPRDGIDVEVNGQAALDALKSEFAQFPGGGPVRQLIRININLDGFRAAPDAGRPAAGSRDAGRRAVLDADPSIRPGAAVPVRRPRALDARDEAVVDEVFRRGGSVGDALGVLYMRTTRKLGLEFAPARPGALPAFRRAAAGQRGMFTLEDRGLLRDEEPPQLEQRADAVEALRPLVTARYEGYVAAVKAEFDALQARRPAVAKSFTPMKAAPFIDSFDSPEEKYRALRGAHYRDGWTCAKRDIYDQIVAPWTFFGATVEGGVHVELASLLARIEVEIQAQYPALVQQLKTAGFKIGGFVPRFQAGTTVLSNHARGLAIDIDADWNPQMKTPAARKAFARATGDDVGTWLYGASSVEAVRKAYERIARMSEQLKRWLAEWLPKHKALQDERPTATKQRRAVIDNELKTNPHLAALGMLLMEYTPRVVESWRAYGIVTIPPEIVVAFTRLGHANAARWGGQYRDSKDIMHLELQQLAGKASLARPGGPGRRPPVSGFADLWSTDRAPAAPDCRAPGSPGRRRPPAGATRG